MKKPTKAIKRKLASWLLGDSIYIGKGASVKSHGDIDIECGDFILNGTLSTSESMLYDKTYTELVFSGMSESEIPDGVNDALEQLEARW